MPPLPRHEKNLVTLENRGLKFKIMTKLPMMQTAHKIKSRHKNANIVTSVHQIPYQIRQS